MKLLSIVVLLLLFSVLGESSALAQKSSKTTKPAAKKDGIQVGDKVEVDWAGQVVTAEVIGRNQVGWYELKFQFNGLELKPTLPPQQVRAIAKEGDKKPAAGTPSVPVAGAGGSPKGVAEADWSNVEQITLGNPERWSVKVEAAPTSRQKLTTKSIPLSRTLSSIISQFHSLLFARQKAQAFAVVVDPTAPAVNLQRLDLVEGKAANPMKLPVASMPCDVDDNGELLLSRSDAFLARSSLASQVSLWKVGANGIEHRNTWDPEKGTLNGFGNRIATGAPPEFARLVAADRVLTVCFPGNMTLWDATNAKAIYTLDVSPGSVPALSPGKRSVAVSVNSGVWLLDALTGRTLGRLAGDVAPSAELSFRPDGKQLAAVSSQQLQVWNLETGELHRDIQFSSRLFAMKLDWLTDGYVLIGGENLVDLERRVVLWQYQHAEAANLTAHRTSGELGGTFWYGLTSKDRTVMSVFRADLPHAQAKQTAAGLKPDDLLAVKPGSRIALQLNVQGTAAEQETVRTALTAKLKELGMTVAADGTVTLTASTETGESRKINYESIGKSGPAESATVTEQISRLRLVADGRSLWESSRVVDAPFTLSRKPGQSLQDALAPYQKPDLSFFSQAKIPQHIAKLQEKGAFGASLLNHQGVQPATVREMAPANAR